MKATVGHKRCEIASSCWVRSLRPYQGVCSCHIAAEKAGLTFTSLVSSSLFVSIRPSNVSHHPADCLWQEVIIKALQKPSGLLVPCCVVPPVYTGVTEVPHEDKGLQT